MKKQWLALSLALALAGTSSALQATGNTEAGKEKSAACAGCHGELGNSVAATFPKLAQQHPAYLVKQLQAFKNGDRKDPMMSAIAMSLSDKDMADIAAYYAEHRISDNPLPILNDDDDAADKAATIKPEEKVAALIKQGGDLYRNGDLTREVSACIACHDPQGKGNKPAGFPLVKSQHADYLIKTLSDFKSGARSNNPENIMHMIATKMTDDEIKAVAYYISMMK
ncbi:MAG: c-type cytochrome [Methylovulum sp.]|nr:c-type cytochrome [Methylovulum sp.]